MAAMAWPRQIRISGGSSETEENEFTVSPWGTPLASITPAMATPVAKRPQARRNSSLETGSARVPEDPRLT